ncbi:MAG: thioredoxin family protein [Verrucomicrobiota bacterium]
MKRMIWLMLTIGMAVSGRGAEAEWLTDAGVAQARAREQGKYVLLDFTGSDWCGWCMKLKAEVFSQPEFVEFAREKLVLVEVDFPRRKAMSAAQRAANQRLADTYRIEGYPTIILLDPEGRLAGQAGYMPGGPKKFDARLEQLMKSTPPRPSAVEEPAAPSKPRVPAAMPSYPAPTTNYYAALQLKGLSGSKARRLALINNQTFLVGDTLDVRVQNRDVVVCCKEIREDSVLITADDKEMELKLGKH